MSTKQHHLMPLYFNSLVLETTTRCTARCNMCYQSVGPKGSEKWGKLELGYTDLEPVVREARQIQNLFPKLHIAGGEAFINLDLVISLVELGRISGYYEISSTTNAFWANSRKRASQIAKDLSRAGLTSIEISWDYWHQGYIKTEYISNALRAAHSFGIDSNLRILTSTSHSVEEAIEPLKGSWDLAKSITWSPVFCTGRADRTLSSKEFYSSYSKSDACHHVLNLTVNPRGDVFPCCAGIEQTDNLGFGNVLSESITSIAKNLERNMIVRQLVFQGIGSFDNALNSASYNPVPDPTSMCNKCWKTFDDTKAVGIIEDYLRNEQFIKIQKALSKLKEERSCMK